MTQLTRLAQVLNGLTQNLDLTAFELVTGSLTVGGVSGTNLTKTLLDRLLNTQNGTDLDATYHTHDTLYAKRDLSNLSATAINQDLIPNATTRRLGSGALYWSTAFINSLDDSSGSLAIDTFARQLKSGATTKLDWSGTDLSVNTRKIINVQDPSAAQDAATKNYVDTQVAAYIEGIKPKAAVRVGTLVNGTLATSFANGQVVDGVTLVTGDRILIKNQTLSQNNGIYIVQASGAPVRSTDMDSLTPIDEVNGAYTFIRSGTQAGQGWVEQSDVAVLGTDPMTWVYFNDVGGLIGGDGITVTGSTVSADLSATGGLASTNPGNIAGQTKVNLEASNPSLQVNGSNELGAKLDPAGTITSGASGLKVGVDNSTIEVNTNALRVKDAGITLAKLASNSVDENKIVSTAHDATMTGGSGAQLSVASSPQVQKSLVAGEAYAANTSFLVRWAVTGESANRVYKADSTSATTNGKFYAIGVALSTSSVSAGQSIMVVLLGSSTLGSSDTPFASGDVGKALYLTTSGAFSITPPSAAGTAAYRIGMVQDVDKIWIDSKQLNGIN